MIKIWEILKTAWHLVNHYHDDISLIKRSFDKSVEIANNHRNAINKRMDQHEEVILHARDQIIERTTINSDVHIRENSATIVVIGRYRNADYVRMFSVRNSELNYLVDQLSSMERSMLGRIRYVDAPLNLSAVIKRNSER